MRPSTVERRSPTRWDAVVVAIVLFCALLLGWFLYVPRSNSSADTVTITRDGVQLGVYHLSQLSQPITMEVDGPFPLTVQLSPKSVQIIHHSCLNGDCAKQKLTVGNAGQLICLPNHTIISLTGETSPIFDAITR